MLRKPVVEGKDVQSFPVFLVPPRVLAQHMHYTYIYIYIFIVGLNFGKRNVFAAEKKRGDVTFPAQLLQTKGVGFARIPPQNLPHREYPTFNKIKHINTILQFEEAGLVEPLFSLSVRSSLRP